jgi:adenylyltransferase/sulfurtransferase
MLSINELNTYERQLGIKSWSQEKIKASTVFVAGAGGLGSPVLYYLSAAGVGNIIICDNDKVDYSNLNRQILHSTKWIGKYKALSAFETLSELNPYISITPITEKITDANAADFAGNSDLIIDCLDNFKARHVLNRISVKKNIPLIHGGVSELGGQVSFLNPPETPCLNCIIPDKDSNKKNFIIGSTAGLIGSIQATEALKHLSGIGASLKNKLLFIDGLSMKFSEININKNPSCKVCGNL